MINLEINEQKVRVEEGDMIIEAADQLGIYIPRYCYHRKLSIAANCRMCLVEVEGARGPAAACATMVTEGMKVYTTSKAALDAQKAVMEFLLLNHPLDCPVCDQGGECELQDQALGYGLDYSDYDMTKRAVDGDNLGPLVETEMTRCIHCTRCVRFGIEIAGMKELGLTGRGDQSRIGTYIDHIMGSELSGNIIDICPVGALTSKPFRYQARAWEMESHASVSPHDCVGTNVFHHTRSHEYTPVKTLMRTVPKENESINECWIADRDRFSYLGLEHADRVKQPMVKRSGQWKPASWEQVLLEIADRTQAIIEHQGPAALAALASPSTTMEEGFLLQKMMRSLGADNIDYRVHQSDFSDQETLRPAPGFNFSLEEMDRADCFLIVGGYTRDEQPILSHRINKAAQEGASVYTVALADYAYKFQPKKQAILAPQAWAAFLCEVAVALDTKGELDKQLVKGVTPSAEAKAYADALTSAKQAYCIIGSQALHSEHASQVRAWASKMAELAGAKVGIVTDGSNSAGLDWVGCLPHRSAGGVKAERAGLHAHELLNDKPVRGYFLYNLEVEHDAAFAGSALEAVKEAGLVVCFASFQTEAMQGYADFILPIAPYTESAGSYMNVEGVVQTFAATSVPAHDARPGWKVLRALSHFLGCEGMAYKTIESVRNDIPFYSKDAQADAASLYQVSTALEVIGDSKGLSWQVVCPLYRSDALVRRAGALQAARPNTKAALRMHPDTAKAHGLSSDHVCVEQGEDKHTCTLELDDKLAANTVVVVQGFDESLRLKAGGEPALSEAEAVAEAS